MKTKCGTLFCVSLLLLNLPLNLVGAEINTNGEAIIEFPNNDEIASEEPLAPPQIEVETELEEDEVNNLEPELEMEIKPDSEIDLPENEILVPNEEFEQLPETELENPVPEAQVRKVINEDNANRVAQENIQPVVQNAFNHSYSKETLGYLAGASITWHVEGPLIHHGIDMKGFETNYKFNGWTELLGDIEQISADGTLKFSYNQRTQVATLTRLKNKLTTPNVQQGLTYRYQADYAYQTWRYVTLLGWFQVKDRFGTINQTGTLTDLNLELPPTLVVEPKENPIEVEQFEQLADNPADYLTISQQMPDSHLAVEWVTQPQTDEVGHFTARVRVTATLDDYQQIAETDLTVVVTEPGRLILHAPDILAFNVYQKNSQTTTVTRAQRDWSLIVTDTRKPHVGTVPSWQLSARTVQSNSELNNYLYFVDQYADFRPLNDAVVIVREGKGPESTINWAEMEGILLIVPGDNQLSPGEEHQTKIIWNLSEGP